MKEIGGYFGLEQLISHEYYPELIPVNNARNGLLYILRTRQISKIRIPFYLCDSVSRMCEREGISYSFYRIDKDFMPMLAQPLEEGEWLYIVNYYGQITNEQLILFQKQYKRVIFDNVQAFFQQPVSGIDTVYSCRKFFGVPDGGYVSSDAQLFGQIPEDESRERMKHILGRFESGSASAYYADFKNNDHSFRELPLRKMSALTHNLLGAIDYSAVKVRRESNFDILHQALGAINKLSLKKTQGPYVYPFYCQGGMEIKKKLAQRLIYVATLWPNVVQLDEGIEKDYAENILPLPCDQRYDAEDMNRIVEAILQCIN